MKKRIGSLVCVILLLFSASALADVKLDAKHFPDALFREELKEFDTDNNGSFSDAEIEAVWAIGFLDKNIKSVKGIEYFPALNILSCNDTQITELDVSKNTELHTLECAGTKLTKLDISKNTKLTDLDCSRNQLTELDVSKSPELIILACGMNKLKRLDVSNNTRLTQLSCFSNSLDALDISKNTELTYLSVSGNPMKQVNISGIPALLNAYTLAEPKKLVTSIIYELDYVTALQVDADDVVITDGQTHLVIMVSSIKLNKTKATLKKGNTLQLKVKSIKPKNADNKDVVWSTTNKKVATVSKSGKVKAKGKGTCYIVCTAADGSGAEARCKITVR